MDATNINNKGIKMKDFLGKQGHLVAGAIMAVAGMIAGMTIATAAKAQQVAPVIWNQNYPVTASCVLLGETLQTQHPEAARIFGTCKPGESIVIAYTEEGAIIASNSAK